MTFNICFVFVIIHLYGCRQILCELKPLSVIGKSATMSSDWAKYPDRHPPGHAIDGSGSSIAHTDTNDPHPWWRVDLGGEHCLGKVTVLLRGDCCEMRFIGAVVRAGISSNYADNQQCGHPATSVEAHAPGVEIPFLCEPSVLAKYVSVDIDPALPGVTKAMINVAEVTVDEYTSSDECVPRSDPMDTPQPSYFGTLKKKGLIEKPSVESRQLMLCARQCIKKSGCRSFNFNPVNGQCQLNDHKPSTL